MYEDILGPKKKKIKPIRVKWDLSVYEDCPYCPNCGSVSLTVIRDHLCKDSLEKDMRCNSCGCEWQEIWNKDIELQLKELKLDVR